MIGERGPEMLCQTYIGSSSSLRLLKRKHLKPQISYTNIDIQVNYKYHWLEEYYWDKY